MSGIARRAAEAAKRASEVLGVASEEVRNEALFAMAAALRAERAFILEANERDMNAAREAGTKEGLLDRLMLDDARVEAMAASLESLAALPDPTGAVLEERTLYNDLKLTRVSVPLGVVAMVYEARPNVTVDAAGICVKSGNACVLRSGSLAIHSAVALGEVLQGALSQVGLPKDCVVVIDSTIAASPMSSSCCAIWSMCSFRVVGQGSFGTAWSIRSFRSSKPAREIAISTSTNPPILPRRIRSC